MSDRIDDLKRFYQKHVRDGYARSAGLFSIPEYPEYESRKGGMWSSALKIILTTLRFLAPATLLTLLWGQQSFLFRILKQIDLAIKTIIYSSEDQIESVLKWLSETGPIKVDTLDTVWHHGWIVCGVLDAAMPGACAGHPPTPLSMKHAQTIADHYLGVEPVFSKQELESEDQLSKHQEWKLAQYLERIREALSKIPTPVSKPCSQRTSPEIPQFTMDYTAKGSGLTAAQIDSKMFFKIYPSAQQSLEPGEIKVLIKGPKDKYGLAVIPPILGKAQSIRQKLLDLEQKPHYTQSTLPLIQGTTYLRTYGKNDMKKTYHIPKSQYDIKIDAEIRPEYAKVGYVVDSEGRYEIFITSRGLNIVGSPFTVTASYNIIDDLEKDSFCLEDGEEIDLVDFKTDRKVVLRIVDFVSEKMLLKEDGELEKISDEEAKLLMKTEKDEPESLKETLVVENEIQCDINKLQDKAKKIDFKFLSCKLIIVLRFCRILKENKISQVNTSKNSTQQSSDDRDEEIPDIINSTFSETFLEKHSISERLEPKCYEQDQKSLESEYFDTNDKYLKEIEKNSLDKVRSFSPNNPFIGDVIRENTASTSTTSGLDFPFLDDIPIKIFIEEDESKAELVTTNPFIEPGVLEIERPKTPVLKIITGEAINRDTIYVDPCYDTVDDSVKVNEFINPFYLHGHLQQGIDETPVADFIIGAPVSLPPIVKTSTPEPTMESIMYTCRDESIYKSLTNNNTNNLEYSSESNDLNSNIYDSKEVIPKNHDDQTLKRDMWDSAYVSIDDSSSSPDSNNNDNLSNEQPTKNRFSPSDMTEEDFINMGPAEQEFWESCTELCAEKPKINNGAKNIKVDMKRNIFTPIQEESDRSMSVDPKDFILAKSIPSSNENEQVTVALAELNNACNEFLTNSDDTLNNYYRQAKAEQLFTTQRQDNSVKSASENETDVMRPKFKKLEGAISEVQSKATELSSASQGLHVNNKSKIFKSEGRQSSIVLEKKKYWDEKIKEIEDISKQQQQEKKRKLSIRHTKNNDSLTRRKGKQIVKNFLQAGDNCQPVFKDTISNKTEKHLKPKSEFNKECQEKIENDDKHENNIKLQTDIEKTSPKANHKQYNEINTDYILDMNLKSNKNFSTFKDKYEQNLRKVGNVTRTEKLSSNRTSTLKSEQEKSTLQTFTSPIRMNVENETNKQSYTNGNTDEGYSLKQDYTEEVFKAFENCPKRFFGTSRKRILNKIDSFLGLHNSTEGTPSSPNIPKESGIVSNRVTLFHSISNVEELVWKRMNYQNSKVENITSAQEKAKAPNNFKIENASVHEHKETVNLESKEVKPLVSKLEKSDNINKDLSHVHKNLDDTKRTFTTDKQETDKVKDTIKTQASLKSQVNEAIKRLKIHDTECDDTPVIKNTIKIVKSINKYDNNVQSKIDPICSSNKLNKPENLLRKSSFSRSDMDIFNKVNQTISAGDLDKYKSYDQLPKINVKNFISIYETASKSTERPKSVAKKSQWLKNKGLNNDNIVGDNAVTTNGEASEAKPISASNSLVTPQPPLRLKKSKSISKEKLPSQKVYETPSYHVNNVEENYISLNDIDIEIIEKPAEINTEVKPDINDDFTDPIDYKSRFNKAKDFFKSLEELRENRPVLKKEKACSTSIESLDSETQQKNTKKKTIANTLPLSEPNLTQNDSNKLIKISEKFQVEDLFNDVVEGKLSRQGSLRGIPHKKAVLETFKSMENVSEPKLSPYEISISQLADFAKKNNIKNVQTYLTEYPYLPTTDPSKYHSRIDTKATGLISLKELVNSKHRRNSVPDLRIVPSSTVDL